MLEARGQSEIAEGSTHCDLRAEVAALTGIGELFKILSDDTRSKLLLHWGDVNYVYEKWHTWWV